MKLGERSSVKGLKPLKLLPDFFNCTKSPTTSSTRAVSNTLSMVVLAIKRKYFQKKKIHKYTFKNQKRLPERSLLLKQIYYSLIPGPSQACRYISLGYQNIFITSLHGIRKAHMRLLFLNLLLAINNIVDHQFERFFIRSSRVHMK